MPNLTHADILNAIRVAESPPANTDPAWKTAEQWAQGTGKSAETYRKILQRGVAAGVFSLEKRNVLRKNRVVLADHFKFVQVPAYKVKGK